MTEAVAEKMLELTELQKQESTSELKPLSELGLKSTYIANLLLFIYIKHII